MINQSFWLALRSLSAYSANRLNGNLVLVILEDPLHVLDNIVYSFHLDLSPLVSMYSRRTISSTAVRLRLRMPRPLTCP